MKSKPVFWGVFLIVLGGLIFINNFVDMHYDWSLIWNFWPVLLILFGLHFIFRNSEFRWIFSAVNALVLSILIFAAFKNMTMMFDDEDFKIDYTVDNYNIPYKDNYKHAKLNMEAATGYFALKDTSSADLINAQTQGNFEDFNLENSENGESTDVSLNLQQHNIRVGWYFPKNKMNLKINNKPVWDMDLNVGAAKVDFDLTPYNMENIYVKSGAAYIKMKLGDKSEKTDVKFESGVTSLDIYVPKTSGCEINSELKVTSREFDGFNKMGNGVYRTENFTTAQKKIYLDMEGGMSKVKVKRY